jgi:hypothetical protein
MRRMLLTSAGTVALALAVPGTALAHHGHGHHHRHHHHLRAHHAKFRHVHIGAGVTNAPGSSSGTTTPPAPVSTPENAGTVASYTNGVLTLTLSDGSTVSGKVTADTRIGCLKATPTAPAPGTGGPPVNQGVGEDNDQGDDQGHNDMGSQGGPGSGQWQHGDQGKGDDRGGEVPGASEPPCDSSALVTGAVVRAAELRIGPGGSEFESIWLVR